MKLGTRQNVPARCSIAPPPCTADDYAVTRSACCSGAQLSNSCVHAHKVIRVEEAISRALVPYVRSREGATDKHSAIREVTIRVRILAAVKYRERHA